MDRFPNFPGPGAALSLSALLLLVSACELPRVSGEPREHRRASRRLAARNQELVPVSRTPALRQTRPAAQGASEEGAVRALLHARKIGNVSFTEETGDFAAVVKLIRTVSGIPIVVSPEARAVVSNESLSLQLDLRAPISIAHLLDLMVGASPRLAWTVRQGVVLLTTVEKAGSDIVMRTHDVRDLTFPRTEFLPPVIRGIPSGEETGHPRSGGEGAEKVSAIEPDSLIQAVVLASDPGYWNAEGGGTLEYLESGHLLVRATPEMHRRVAKVLFGLR